MRDGPRLSKCPMAGPSREGAERAHRSGRLDMGADKGSSDSDISSEKKHQKECRRAAAWLWREFQFSERMGLCSRGLTRKGKVREDLKLHELMQAREREPSTPDSAERFGQGILARLHPLPNRVPSTIEPPRGGFQDNEDPTENLRLSEDAKLLPKYSRHLPSTRGPPPSPERHSRFYTHPSRGNRQDLLSEFPAPFFAFLYFF